MDNQYASVAIFDLASELKVSISVISVTPNEVVLSGSWVLKQSKIDEISLVLKDRLAIPLSPSAETTFPGSKFGYEKVSIKEFFSEAHAEALSNLDAFNLYKNEDLKKRKNLVAPVFYDWTTPPNLADAEIVLKSMSLSGIYEETASEMKSVLPAARLVQFYITKWQTDEAARSGRKYASADESQAKILPSKWLN